MQMIKNNNRQSSSLKPQLEEGKKSQIQEQLQPGSSSEMSNPSKIIKRLAAELNEVEQEIQKMNIPEDVEVKRGTPLNADKRKLKK